MQPDLVSILLDSISLAIILGMGFYSLKLILVMRRGALEKSWRYISAGSLFLVFGIVGFAVSSIMGSILLFNLSEALMICGGSLMLLGLRSHYEFWQLPKMKLAKDSERLSDLI